MAGRTSSHGGMKHVHHLFAPEDGWSGRTCAAGDEFDESDVWSGLTAEPRRPAAPARAARRKPDHVPPPSAAAAGSLPVNVPDWSKILGRDYKGGMKSNSFVEEGEEDGEWTGAVIPPHELVCRSRGASFSVHEGIGRTLKGRDLSRVRDAVWERTGFQD